MPYDRSYDYATPAFFSGGFGFTCAPPPVNTTRSDRRDAYSSSRADSINRSRQDFASSRQSSFARSDSLSSQKSLSRADSLTNRAPLTRQPSGTSSLARQPSLSSSSTAAPPPTGVVTSTSEYSTDANGRPSHYSSTVYKSPYGKTHRFNSHF